MAVNQNKLKQDVAAERQRQIVDTNYQFYTAHVETTERGTLMLQLLTKQLDELSQHDKHVWDSSEYTQVTAVAAWIAGARAAIVGDLLNCAYKSDPESPLGCDLTQPVRDDLAIAIDGHATISEAWVNYRDEVSIDPDFRLGDNHKLGSTYDWPAPEKVSMELFQAMQYMTGVRGAVDFSTVIDQKLASTVMSPEHMHPHFTGYNKTINARYASLLKQREILRVRNRSGDLSPAHESGRVFYSDMVQLLEAAVALGVNRLYPASLDPKLRLNEKHGKKPEPSEIILPLLDPHTMTSNPILPTFAREDVMPTSLIQEQKPLLPSVDGSYVQDPAPLSVIETFDPSTYFGSSTKIVEPLDEKPKLAMFDPSSYFDK